MMSLEVQLNFWFGIHTALKSVPLKQYHGIHVGHQAKTSQI